MTRHLNRSITRSPAGSPDIKNAVGAMSPRPEATVRERAAVQLLSSIVMEPINPTHGSYLANVNPALAEKIFELLHTAG